MFNHLHVHTEYSLLDGMNRISLLIKQAKKFGMPSIAITDHGNMYGAIKFYQAAKKAGIKPIIGCEVYITRGSRLKHDQSEKNSYHLVLLSKNSTGYHNLLELVTKANLEGFYYKPRADRELIATHHEGLIALSACLGGEIPQLILKDQLDEAKETARWYHETFNGDFYLELQRHGIPEQKRVNEALIEMSRELNIPLVATNDIHYLKQSDAVAHDLLLCIGTNSTVSQENRLKMAGDCFYLKSPDEMQELFQDVPEALENTARIAESCNLELDFNRLHLPKIDIPEGKTPFEYLSNLCYEGLKIRYPNAGSEIQERLAYELDVIDKTEFANYFLVVWDIVSFVRKNKIFFGVRGSAAASIVLRCLDITDIDPMAHTLVFERFLNIERKEMPDIDLDFEDARRDEVINYVSQKYGADHVAQIATFGTLGARAAIRDSGRALGIDHGYVDQIARLIPFGINMTLEQALQDNKDLKSLFDSDSIAHKLIASASQVEGTSRHVSTHAAGVVISREPLTCTAPLQRLNRGNNQELVMTQFTKEDIAHVGLLKMDFLGLANLTIMRHACEIIKQSKGIDIDLNKIPMDDEKTFQLLSSGETTGVFQLEGSGMRRYIKQLKPTTFSDISAIVALYRPGPMEQIPHFIKAKHGEEPIHYPHPALENILEETYGVIVYQEQVLFIVQQFAGYTLGQADIFRKAISKKIAGVMKQEKEHFITGAIARGFSQELAEEVFALIEPFAGYAFNKAHSVSYALVAYRNAYLKANFPLEYITALLISQSGDLEKVANTIGECRRMNIEVLRPDINNSDVYFVIEPEGESRKPAIRFGLSAIKNVGEGAVEPLVSERKTKGNFKSVEDLCSRATASAVNRRVLESLIKSGALDSLGDRGELLASIERILAAAQREQKLRDSGQTTMFDMFGETQPVPRPAIELKSDSVSVNERLNWEKQLLGTYVSAHPLSAITTGRERHDISLCGEITEEMAGKTIKVIGMVSSIRYLYTKDRKPFISVLLEDLNGQVNVMVWPRVYSETIELWQENSVLMIEGKVRAKDSKPQLSCNAVSLYQPENDTETDNDTNPSRETPLNNRKAIMNNRNLTISLKQSEDIVNDKEKLHQILEIMQNYPGEDNLLLRIVNGTKIYNLKMPSYRITYCTELENKLAQVVGKDALQLVS